VHDPETSRIDILCRAEQPLRVDQRPRLAGADYIDANGKRRGFQPGGKQPDMAGQAVRRAISKARGIVERGRGVAGDLSRGKRMSRRSLCACDQHVRRKGSCRAEIGGCPLGHQAAGQRGQTGKAKRHGAKTTTREITRLCGRERIDGIVHACLTQPPGSVSRAWPTVPRPAVLKTRPITVSPERSGGR
jgi:hypothetical protein